MLHHHFLRGMLYGFISTAENQRNTMNISPRIKKIYSKDKKAKNYTLEEKCKIYKFGKIKEFMSQDTSYYDMVPDLIPFALGVIKVCMELRAILYTYISIFLIKEIVNEVYLQ